MTVITMSRTELTRLRVLIDIADGRLSVADATGLIGVGRRQIYRLLDAFRTRGADGLISRKRGRPSNRAIRPRIRVNSSVTIRCPPVISRSFIGVGASITASVAHSCCAICAIRVVRYRRRVTAEAPYELRRHLQAARLTWLAAFGHLHGRTLTDDLADLLIETIHHIGARAERRVERELLDDVKRVAGKQNLLFDLAGAVLEQPDGIVRDVVFPVVGEQTLRDLVKEAKATGPSYRTTLRTVIRNSYKGHYRRVVPEILQHLEFRSNNAHHRPIIEALDLLKRYAGTRLQTFPAEEPVPIQGIVPGLWREAVVEKDGKGRQRINRITYEICVLEALRDKLRCKEVWVVGANRYRNPDEDLPADFEVRRTPYYEALKLPLEADRFIADLQAEMREALQVLDAGMPGNRRVRIDHKRGKDAWITVTPFDPLPEAPNLTAVKAETVATWPMTGLLDMLKEADLRLNFTDTLKSVTAYETLDRAVLRPRLLLCLNGLGTNAGFQRMAGLQSGTMAKDLAYVRRRYVTVDALRQAIAIVTNGTLRAPNPAIWGEGTTACASDSKHFGA